MRVFTDEISRSTEQSKLIRRPRNHQDQIFSTESDPNPHASRPSKSTISSLFLSHLSNNPPAADPPTTTTSKKKSSTTFRGLGCTAGAAEQVSIPAVIRSSAEWEGKTVKKKKTQQRKREKKKESGMNMMMCSESRGCVAEGNQINANNNEISNGGCIVIQDVWCGPGIGFSSDGVVGSVDRVVARRNVQGRGKVDGEKFNQRERERERERERASSLGRRVAVNPETLSFLDTDPAFGAAHPETEVFGTGYYRHVRHPSPDGLAEMMMVQNSFMMGARMDRFSNWRLDIDNMTYEQLIELGDRIGYVSTGLKDDEIGNCVRKVKVPLLSDLPLNSHIIVDKNCSICQEEYEAEDELGKLECGHGFHIQCIKQWLAQKNACPVCKSEPVARG